MPGYGFRIYTGSHIPSFTLEQVRAPTLKDPDYNPPVLLTFTQIVKPCILRLLPLSKTEYLP